MSFSTIQIDNFVVLKVFDKHGSKYISLWILFSNAKLAILDTSPGIELTVSS